MATRALKELSPDEALAPLHQRRKALELERQQERANAIAANDDARKRAEDRLAVIDAGLAELDTEIGD